ncbi:MAG: PTS sugar transporter subunit IIB [Candidatus Poribacteria bacterium]
MPIDFVRIDDRFIHAQIIWGWVPRLKPTQIIVINDIIASNENRKKILLMAGEQIKNVKVRILSLEEAITDPSFKLENQEKTFLIIGNPSDALFLIKNNIIIKSISLGCISERPGKTRILATVSIDDKDIKAFTELIKTGVEIKYQETPSDKPEDFKVPKF